MYYNTIFIISGDFNKKKVVKQLDNILKKSSLQRMREECKKSGGDLLNEMGYFHIKGIKSAMYEPYKFSSWLFDNRLVSEGKYDYEVAEVNKVKEGLIKLATINQPINLVISNQLIINQIITIIFTVNCTAQIIF